MGHRRDHWARILLASGSFLLCLLVLEGSLAIFYPSRITARPYTERNFFCDYHPVLGWANRPGFAGSITLDDGFSFMVNHNARGQRGKEYPHERTPGRARVVVLGDSFAWGFGVEDGDVFPSLLERLPPRPEVVNLGVSGYATDQEFLAYLDEGHKYRPDLVVLAFFAANDLAEIASSSVYGYPKPFLEPGSDPLLFRNVPVPRTGESDRLLYDNPPTAWGKLKKFLRRRTHAYPFIARRLNSVPALRRLFLKTGLGEAFREGPDTDLRPAPGQGPDRAWQTVFTLMRKLGDEARKDQAALLILNIPKNERKPGLSAVDAAGIAGLNDEVSRRLGEFSVSSGIFLLDMTRPIREAQAAGIACYSSHPRDIHLNREGHRRVAMAISRWLTANLH